MSGRSAALKRSRSSSPWRASPLIDLITSDGPSVGENARENASTSPTGFLRSIELKKSNTKRNTKPSGSDTSARPIDGSTSGAEIDSGTFTTGTGEPARIDAATNSDEHHTSSTRSNEARCAAGNCSSSHHQ